MADDTSNSSLTGVSLFTGAGGLDVGFEAAGIRTVVACELNDDACDSFAANHSGVMLLRGDINSHLSSFYAGQADIVFGGPPCQGFSQAGKRDPNDPRSALVFSFLNVVERIQPKAFVMENVRNLAESDTWSGTRALILDRASELGYSVEVFVLDAAEFGVSQRRKRAFFVGVSDQIPAHDSFRTKFEEALRTQKRMPLTVRELFASLPAVGSSGNPVTCASAIVPATNPVPRSSWHGGLLYNGRGRPLNPDSIADTIPASMGGNHTPFVDEVLLADPAAFNWCLQWHREALAGVNPSTPPPASLRRITAVEAAALQSFPKGYAFRGSKSAVYLQIGNAVPPKLGETVARALRASLSF